jgi:hypothetical protein
VARRAEHETEQRQTGGEGDPTMQNWTARHVWLPLLDLSER